MKLKPFYIRAKDEDETLSRSFDLQYGYLELSSGGTRLYDPGDTKITPKRARFQICPFKTIFRHLIGDATSCRLGDGIRQIDDHLVGIDNVREVVLYPRDPDRLTP